MGFSSMEVRINAVLQSFSSPVMDGFWQTVTLLGNPLVWVFLAAFVYWQGKRNESFWLMNALAASLMAVGLAKGLVHRLRPFEQFQSVKQLDFDYASQFSFPSGHAAIVGTATGYYLSLKRQWKVLLFIALAFVMASRVYLGMHFVSDVVAGALMGLGIGWIFLKLEKRFDVSKTTKIFNRVGMLALLAIFMAGFYLIPPEYVYAGIFIGYYLGVFSSNAFNVQLPVLEITDGKKLLMRQGRGMVGLIVILGPMAYFNPALNTQLALYFLAGFWISYLFPRLESALFKNKTK